MSIDRWVDLIAVENEKKNLQGLTITNMNLMGQLI
jgi:hypothetical protein